MRTRRLLPLATALLLVIPACHQWAADADDDAPALKWQNDVTPARLAARKSGKRIFVYIYQHNRPACVEMERTTFADPEVVKALSDSFELLAIAANSSRQADFLRRYRVGVQKDVVQSDAEAEYEVEVLVCPVYLLIDESGRELLRLFNYHPPQEFAAMVGQMKQICALTDRLAKTPGDALAMASLGHIYLELERPESGEPLLRKAVSLDTENKAGARQEAELDLLILDIPADPDSAFRRLAAYRSSYPGTSRGLEIQYYMAVCQVGMERFAQAEVLLQDFGAIPAKTADGKDNPDYRSPWTERAVLLLRQLRSLTGEEPAK